MREQRCFFPAFLTPEGKKKPSAPSLLVGQKLSLAPADYRFLPNEDSQSQPSLRASARFHQGRAATAAKPDLGRDRPRRVSRSEYDRDRRNPSRAARY